MTRVLLGLQRGDCRRCKPRSWGFFGQAHASGKAPHSRPRGLTLETDERPPSHGKPQASKVFQRYQLAQQSPPPKAQARIQAWRYRETLRSLEFAVIISGSNNDDPLWKIWTDGGKHEQPRRPLQQTTQNVAWLVEDGPQHPSQPARSSP